MKTIGRGARRTRVAAITALLAAGLAAFPAAASAGSDDTAVLTGLTTQVLSPAIPVLGTDRVNHLAYEIRIINTSGLDATINSVRPRANGKAFGPPLTGDALSDLLNVYASGAGQNVIPAGGAALLFMDVQYARKAKPPRRLNHAFSVTLTDPTDPSKTQDNSFVGVPEKILNEKPLVVEPPLSGDRWVVANGCCNPINAHRGAALNINGTSHVAQRFAIDFVQLNEQNKLLDGPIDQLSSYSYFGAEDLSATAGKVVRVRDGEPEQVPGELPQGQTVNTADGNYVVVKVDRDHYAFYAHMQPGSIRVEVGDRVKPGQVLGLLGNTGNTDGPHLHFHIMDGPSPLQSNGVPFVFSRFVNQGLMTNGADLQALDFTAQIDPAIRGGSFKRTMPLGLDVVDFGG